MLTAEREEDMRESEADRKSSRDTESKDTPAERHWKRRGLQRRDEKVFASIFFSKANEWCLL